MVVLNLSGISVLSLLLLLVIDATGVCYADHKKGQQDNIKSAKPQIEWLLSDAPPFTIGKGPLKNQGHGDAVYRVISEKLTEYQHHREIADRSYAQGGIVHYDNACAYNLFKTKKRSEYMVFSKPIYSILPLGVVTLADNDVTGLLDENGHFVLSRLADNDAFALGLMANRSYGEALDQQLKGLSKGKSVVTMSAITLAAGLLNMLALKRIDGSLGYVTEAFYLTKLESMRLSTEQASQPDTLVYYPLAVQPTLLYGRVGCNRGKFGERVIAAINKTINADEQAQMAEAYQQWIPRNAALLYQQLIKKNDINQVK